MTRDVLISISGVQFSSEDQTDIEMITTGDYYMRNGKHYIRYDEVAEGEHEVISNTIKVGTDTMDIIKKGLTSAHMTFEKNKKSLTCYATAMGDMMIGICTNHVLVEETERILRVLVKYSLDINYEHISDCNIIVAITPRETQDYGLQ